MLAIIPSRDEHPSEKNNRKIDAGKKTDPPSHPTKAYSPISFAHGRYNPWDGYRGENALIAGGLSRASPPPPQDKRPHLIKYLHGMTNTSGKECRRKWQNKAYLFG